MMDLHNTVLPSITNSSSLMMGLVPSSFPNLNKHLRNEILSIQSIPSSPQQLQPTFGTVVIGKGKVPRKAPGNLQLGGLVQSKLQEYVNAKSKMVKSSIVTDIYFAIQEACFREGGPAFVRYDGHGYMVVTESVAREKITSKFRDCLHDRYKSSSKNKVAKRRLANEKKTAKERKRIHIQGQDLLKLAVRRSSSSSQQLDTTKKIIRPLPQARTSLIEQQQQQQNKTLNYVPELPMSSIIQQQQNNIQISRHSSQLQMSSLIAQQQQIKIQNMRLVASRQLQRVDTFVAPMFEFLVPVDNSVFDTPLPALDCASTSSTSDDSDGFRIDVV